MGYGERSQLRGSSMVFNDGYSMRPLANFSIEPLSKLKIFLNACLLNIKNTSSQLDWLKSRYVMSREQTF